MRWPSLPQWWHFPVNRPVVGFQLSALEVVATAFAVTLPPLFPDTFSHCQQLFWCRDSRRILTAFCDFFLVSAFHPIQFLLPVAPFSSPVHDLFLHPRPRLVVVRQ